jgi:hypothetical protein
MIDLPPSTEQRSDSFQEEQRPVRRLQSDLQDLLVFVGVVEGFSVGG